jgi:hypothetical protein
MILSDLFGGKIMSRSVQEILDGRGLNLSPVQTDQERYNQQTRHEAIEDASYDELASLMERNLPPFSPFSPPRRQ